MSTPHDLSSDEYVARLLADDAKQSSIKYSSMGLSALLPKRPTQAALKPNTRFLQTILRETDSHNAALKKKEELEARIRLRNIRSAKTEGPRSERRERKKRHIGDDELEGDLRDYKRRRHNPTGDYRNSSTRGDSEWYRNRHPHRSGHDGTDGSDGDRRQKSRQRHMSHRNRPASPGRSSHHRGRRKSPSESSDFGHHADRRSRRKRKHDRDSRLRIDEKPPSDHRTGPYSTKNNHNTHSPSPSPPPSSIRPQTSHKKKASPSPSPSSTSSSDPLEDIVGPLPATRPHNSNTHKPPFSSRGRNAYRHPTSKTAIDTHFTPTYDPTLDLGPDPDPEPEQAPSQPDNSKPNPKSDGRYDWDTALEALQDRLLWRKRGAQRLRDVGFGEVEVRRWQEQQEEGVMQSRRRTGAGAGAGAAVVAGGREKDVDDVRWRRRGQEREWDVGKVVM